MPSSALRGGDPDGLAALTRLLDMVADALDRARSELRMVIDGLAVLPAIDRIVEVSGWARDAANDARRVALTVLSDGAGWRHPSLFDHIGGVATAFGAGFVGGVGGIGRGLWAAAGTSVGNTVSGATAVWDATEGDWDGVGKEVSEVARREEHIGSSVAQSVMGLVELQPWVVAWHVREDGVWRAADDWAEGLGQQTPALLLTAATAGAGAEAGLAGALSDVASNVGNAGYLDPRAVGSRGARSMAVDDVRTMNFSVAVDGDPGHRVGLDPSTGDFLVAKADGDGEITVSEKRWSHLSDAERQAMKESRVVNGHGQLVAA